MHSPVVGVRHSATTSAAAGKQKSGHTERKPPAPNAPPPPARVAGSCAQRDGKGGPEDLQDGFEAAGKAVSSAAELL